MTTPAYHYQLISAIIDFISERLYSCFTQKQVVPERSPATRMLRFRAAELLIKARHYSNSENNHYCLSVKTLRAIAHGASLCQ